MKSPSSPATPPTDSPSPETPESPEFVLTLPDDPASGKDWYLWAGVLALLVIVAFFPAVQGKMLWDDEHHVGAIPSLQDVNGLVRIWTSKNATPQYYPLTFTTFWFEHKLWKDSTLGYHLVNILLHAGAAVLVWRLLKRLAIPGAWLAAAIWAVHPLQVESVAWMTERKNILSGLLFFASIWFYLEFAGLAPPPVPNRKGAGLSEDGSTLLIGNRWAAYALSFLCFVLALLSKTIACSMPAVMLVILWWKGRKLLNSKTITPLIPFFLIGLLMAALTVYMETVPGGTIEAIGPDWDLDFSQRLLIAGRALWFYALKLVAPVNLIFSYPRHLPSIATMGAAMYAVQWLYVVCFIIVIAALWLGRKALGRGPLAAVLYYFLTLFPALGFFNIYPMRYSFVADHFQYLSGLGLIVLAVAVLHHLLRKFFPRSEEHTTPTPASGAMPWRLKIAVTCSAAIVLVLAGASWLQAHIYLDRVTLWRDTLAKNGDSWLAADNLGIELIKNAEAKEHDADIERIQGVIEQADSDAAAAKADYKEAEGLFLHVLEIRPNQIATRNSLGILYRATNRWHEAETVLQTAVELDDKQDAPHRLVAPYVEYAKVLMHNHPNTDVQPWLKKALDLQGQPRVKTTELAAARVTLGQYLFDQANLVPQDQQYDYLRAAIRQLQDGLKDLPADRFSRFLLARAYQRLGLADQDRADHYRAAGNLKLAEQFETQSMQVDDPTAMRNFTEIVEEYPWDTQALNGIGLLYVRHVVERDTQSDAIQDLISAMQFFKDAIRFNPDLHEAAANLAGVKTTLMQEAAKDLAAPDSWPVLQAKVTALKSAGTGDSPALIAAATATDRAAETTLWPLAREHPLRERLHHLRVAIANYLAAAHPASGGALAANNPAALPLAVKEMQAACDDVLAHWNDRKPDEDAVYNHIYAAACYEGAVTADEHSADAWRRLSAMADALEAAEAQKSAVPDLHARVEQARQILKLHEAATQPATLPATVK